MENSIQTEIGKVTLDELKRVTWDYSKIGTLGFYQGDLIREYCFEVKNPGSIHPLTIQSCNVAEGWIEHLVCESYPKVKTCAEFFSKAKVKRDENGEFLKKRVYCDVKVKLLGVKGNTLLTLSKE